MKKITILAVLAVTMTAFVQPNPPKKFPIWHVAHNGQVVLINVTEVAARAHLENHPEDWTHPRVCDFLNLCHLN